MGSHTAEPDDSVLTASLGDMKFDGGAHTAAFDGESYYGLAYILGFERQSRTWNFDGVRKDEWFVPNLNLNLKGQTYGGGKIFSEYILRSRINYQFTRELFLRLVVQYNQFGRGLDIEPLLTYKLNPFSIFYIGVTSRYGDFGSFYKSSLRESPIILTQHQRQYFLKFQYLFQV